MTIEQVSAQVIAEKSAKLIRYRKDSVLSGGTAQYDVKDLFTGSNRGWMILDMVTAGALCQLFSHAAKQAERENKPDLIRKLCNLPIPRLTAICWGK